MEKKFVLFIIEGENDKEEINAILHTPYFEEFNKNYRVEFLFHRRQSNTNPNKGKIRMSEDTRGDITSDEGTTEKNIYSLLEKIVRSFLDNIYRGIKRCDIERVVQIVDTDGAFIPDDAVVYCDTQYDQYRSNCIETPTPGSIRTRNGRKAKVLRKMIGFSQIYGIKYQVFFVSKDMEHVLFGYTNMGSVRKRQCRLEFQNQCETKPEIIFDSVMNPNVGTCLDYLSSWDGLNGIQKGTNSLKRSTNLNLLLSELSEALIYPKT